jgi:hypothetical protein
MIKKVDGTVRHYNEADQLHREDGPAITWDHSGDKEWFYNGERHREDGPAVDYDGLKMWYCHGQLHREDGPAIEYKSGRESYYLRGKSVQANSLIEFLGIVRFKAFI